MDKRELDNFKAEVLQETSATLLRPSVHENAHHLDRGLLPRKLNPANANGSVGVVGNVLSVAADGYPAWGVKGVIVAVLPTGVSDGLECYFQTAAMVTAGVSPWHLRYNAGSASAYKWECVGAVPWHAAVDALEGSVTAGSWMNITTQGPLVTVPLAGDYSVSFKSEVVTTGVAVYTGYVGVGAGDVDPGAVRNGVALPAVPSALGALSGVGRLNAVAASTDVKMRYFQVSPSTITWRYRNLGVTPIRVG